MVTQHGLLPQKRLIFAIIWSSFEITKTSFNILFFIIRKLPSFTIANFNKAAEAEAARRFINFWKHHRTCIHNDVVSLALKLKPRVSSLLDSFKFCIRIAWKRAKNKTKGRKIFYDLIIKRAKFLWLQRCKEE